MSNPNHLQTPSHPRVNQTSNPSPTDPRLHLPSHAPHQLPTLRRTPRLTAPAPPGSVLAATPILNRLAAQQVKLQSSGVANLGENPFEGQTPAMQEGVEKWRRGIMSWIQWYPDYPDPNEPWEGDGKGSVGEREKEVEAVKRRGGGGGRAGGSVHVGEEGEERRE